MVQRAFGKIVHDEPTKLFLVPAAAARLALQRAWYVLYKGRGMY